MIQKLTTDLIAQILTNDKFESSKDFNNDKGQWVQFLMRSLNNPNVLMMGTEKEGKLLEFSVTIHHRDLCFLIYISDGALDDPDYKKVSFEWAKKFNCSDTNLKKFKTWDGE